MRFVDTNVLLYSISTAEDETAKAATALQLLDANDLALSVQVLQEFYVQATRPTKPDPLGHDQAATLVEAFARFPVQAIDLAVMQAALETRNRYQISYWDAAVVEAARALNCEVLLSEDLNDGQDYGGIRVQNPFA